MNEPMDPTDVEPSRERPDLYLGNAVIPPELDKEENRAKCGLPRNAEDPGEFMVELNLMHSGGLPAANLTFLTLFRGVIPSAERAPVRVARTYYSCRMSLNDARRLVRADREKAEAAKTPRDRAVYRIWPDFPVKAHIDRSVATIKADAALKSYDASGADIVWAVIDSGIDKTHPHFGDDDQSDPEHRHHTLLAKEVAQLHRCYARVVVKSGTTIPLAFPLPDPDTRPDSVSDEEWQKQRTELLREHRNHALSDEYGHGTHVAGIIAGALDRPDGGGVPRYKVFERTFRADSEGKQLAKAVVERQACNPRRLRGAAPNCKLVSLRVLDAKGDGRASDIMRALEYVREHLNDNPKLMRVHGVNLSVGYEFDADMFACGQSPLCAEVDRLVQSGVVVVTAAGNTGYGVVGADQRATKVGLSNTINDPGNAASAITVGATHRDAPHTYGVSYFSSKGPTGDGRLKPDLVAPGERITSCATGKSLEFLDKRDAGTAYYIDDSGTSMAAPHVSGAIAAFLSIRREFIGKPLEVKRIFLQSATSLGRERYFEGHGLLDLMRAIQSV